MLRRLFHRLAHLLRLNLGEVTVWSSDSGEIMVAFKCAGCGELAHIHSRSASVREDAEDARDQLRWARASSLSLRRWFDAEDAGA